MRIKERVIEYGMVGGSRVDEHDSLSIPKDGNHPSRNFGDSTCLTGNERHYPTHLSHDLSVSTEDTLEFKTRFSCDPNRNFCINHFFPSQLLAVADIRNLTHHQEESMILFHELQPEAGLVSKLVVNSLCYTQLAEPVSMATPIEMPEPDFEFCRVGHLFINDGNLARFS